MAASRLAPDSTDFSCQICFEQFNNKTRLPKRLSCPHTFCLHCLDELPKSSSGKKNTVCTIVCPVCREPTQVKQGLDKLPTDIMLLKMIDYFKCGNCDDISNRLMECKTCDILCCCECLKRHEVEHLCEILKYVRSMESRDPKLMNKLVCERFEQWRKLVPRDKQRRRCDHVIDALISALEHRRKLVHKVFDRYGDYFKCLNSMVDCWDFVDRAKKDMEEGPSVPHILVQECAEKHRNVEAAQAFLKIIPRNLELDVKDLMKKIRQLGEDFLVPELGEITLEEEENKFVDEDGKYKLSKIRTQYGEFTIDPDDFEEKRKVPETPPKKSDTKNTAIGNQEFMDENGRYKLLPYWDDTYCSKASATSADYSHFRDVTKIIDGTKFGKFRKLRDIFACPVTGRLFVADETSIYELDPRNDWDVHHHFKTESQTIHAFCVNAQRQIIVIGDHSSMGQLFVYSETGEYVKRFGCGGEGCSDLDQPNAVACWYGVGLIVTAVRLHVSRGSMNSSGGQCRLHYVPSPVFRPNCVAVNGRGDTYFGSQNVDAIVVMKDVGEYPEMEYLQTPKITAEDGRSSIAIDKHQSLLVAAWDDVKQQSYVSVHEKYFKGECLARIKSEKYPIKHTSVRVAATENNIVMADLRDNKIYVFGTCGACDLS